MHRLGDGSLKMSGAELECLDLPPGRKETEVLEHLHEKMLSTAPKARPDVLPGCADLRIP